MNRFFFEPEPPGLLAVMRAVLGVVLLCETAARWPHAAELYSDLGPAMPAFARAAPQTPATAPPADMAAEAPGAPNLPAWPVPNAVTAVLADSALIFALGAVALGWHTRLSLLGSFALLLWLLPLDLAVSFGKHTVIALQMLLLLACTGCGGRFSVDAWRDAPRATPGAAWPRRLMQFLLCAIYLGAAVTKIKTPHFAHGDLLQYSLLDDAWGGGAFGHWLARQPHLPGLLSLLTIVFELSFPLLAWLRRLRAPMLVLAAAMHAGMGWALHLGSFSPIMLVLLLSFVEPGDIERWLGRFARRLACAPQATPPGRRAAWSVSFALFAMALAACASLGLTAQWHAMGLKARVHGPPAGLEEFPPEQFEQMMLRRLPAFEDYVHRVAVGQRAGWNQVFGASSRFPAGSRLLVMVQFVLPHPSMVLEGLLLAPNGSEAGRYTHRVEPGVTHATDGFQLDPDLPRGLYTLIIDLEGAEVARRVVEIADP